MKFRRGSLVFAGLVGCLLAIALPVHAQSETVNLTSKFLQRGLKIDHLLVYKIGGVVVIGTGVAAFLLRAARQKQWPFGSLAE